MRPAGVAQRGFTLLEALVAIVVVSIGLLGLGALRAVSIASTQTSAFHYLANIAVDDIGNRIQANPSGARNNDYDTIEPLSKADQPPSPDCQAQDETTQEKDPKPKAACTPDQMATVDAWEWENMLRQSLPNGRGTVSCLASSKSSQDSPCRVYIVTVIWHERATPAAQADQDTANSQRQDRRFVAQIRP